MRATIPVVNHKTGTEIAEATDEEITHRQALVATVMVNGVIKPVFVTMADDVIEAMERDDL